MCRQSYCDGEMPSVRRPIAPWIRRSSVSIAALLLALLPQCTEEIRVGQNFTRGDASTPGTGAQGGNPNPIGGAAGTGFPTPDSTEDASIPTPGVCNVVTCGGGQPRDCGNCSDDDGDGRVDGADADCISPCDNDESALVPGLEARVTGNCNTDCYFDRNSGGGRDCSHSFRCDPLSTGPDFPPTGNANCEFAPNDTQNCELTPNEASVCETGCRTLTPNGCDCFGCCELPTGSARYVWLGSEALAAGDCDLTIIDGPGACPRCTPIADCQNDCAECELCIGKTELPATCGSGGAAPTCPVQSRPCDFTAESPCGPLEYCITGCCVPLPT